MSKRVKKEKRPVAKIDFKPYGAAIKAGRTKQKESRNKAADNSPTSTAPKASIPRDSTPKEITPSENNPSDTTPFAKNPTAITPLAVRPKPRFMCHSGNPRMLLLLFRSKCSTYRFRASETVFPFS